MTFDKICTLLYNTEYRTLAEAVVPPFDWNVTVSMINRKGKALEAEIVSLIKILKDNEELFEDYGLREIGFYLPEKLERYVHGNYHATLDGMMIRINDLFKTAQNTDDSHFSLKCVSQYIPDYISYFLKDNPMHRINDYQETFDKFAENAEWYADDKLYAEAALLVERIKKVLNEMQTFEDFLKDLQKKLEAASKWSYGAYNDGRKYRPDDLAEEEIGYHASLHAKQLLESGFKNDHLEADSFGLGGRSYEGHISITLDFKVAQTIAWVYKHLWLIAHNQWKLSSVFEFIHKYSQNPKKDNGGEYTFDKIVEIFKHNKGYAMYPPKDVETLMEFFVHSLWFVDTPINKNPVFFGFDGKKYKDKLLSIDYKDIGVIKVKVKTNNISEFLTAERELRVPADDIEVLSII